MVSPGYGLEAFYTVDKSPHTIIDNNSKNLLKTDTSTFNIDFTQKPFNTGQS
jgi:hypothetical protein